MCSYMQDKLAGRQSYEKLCQSSYSPASYSPSISSFSFIVFFIIPVIVVF